MLTALYGLMACKKVRKKGFCARKYTTSISHLKRSRIKYACFAIFLALVWFATRKSVMQHTTSHALTNRAKCS